MCHNIGMNQDRINVLRQICKLYHVDSFLISSNINISYLSGFNRFLKEHDGYFLVTPTRAFLITSPLYSHAVKKYSPDLALLETTPEVWYAKHIRKVLEEEHIKTVGIDEVDMTVSQYFDLLDEKIEIFSVPLRELRIKKDTQEIAAIQKTSELADKTFTQILPYVKVGVTEIELAEIMKKITRELGGDLPYEPIIAFGENAAVPHHMISDEKLTENGFVLFDYVPLLKGYMSDMSRTVFVGTPTDKQKDIYETVKLSQQKAADKIQELLDTREPIPAKLIDQTARDVITDKQYPIYPHSLGHGIGLEVHEAPTLSVYSQDMLTEGMVFTLEPGIYFPGSGGVRIEDVYTIVNGKLEQLTHSPKDLIVI